jgi:hypothetical protein
MDVSPSGAVVRILREFNQNGWIRRNEVAADLVRALLENPGELNVEQLGARVPGAFCAANQAPRIEIVEALHRALDGVTVIQNPALEGATLAVQSHTAIILEPGSMLVERRIEINNSGQFAGNIDSTDSEVNLERQQQIVPLDQEGIMRDSWEHASVQEALKLPIPDDEKANIAGSRLAKITGVGIDLATSFASKLIAEIAKGQ